MKTISVCSFTSMPEKKAASRLPPDRIDVAAKPCMTGHVPKNHGHPERYQDWDRNIEDRARECACEAVGKAENRAGA
ncbi:hypothetical protein Q1M63_27140 [Sinorhizobium meliloti]|nr:hypothetical protein Q1M63_27140 [Sinorhizobium meliloti]